MIVIDYFKGILSWSGFLKWGGTNVDDSAAWNENKSYVEIEKNLLKLLEQSKELGFIMYTRLNEILGWLIVDWLKVKKEKTITAKETVLLNNLDELHALMERALDQVTFLLIKMI